MQLHRLGIWFEHFVVGEEVFNLFPTGDCLIKIDSARLRPSGPRGTCIAGVPHPLNQDLRIGNWMSLLKTNPIGTVACYSADTRELCALLCVVDNQLLKIDLL